jgi:hypothetical protein
MTTPAPQLTLVQIAPNVITVTGVSMEKNENSPSETVTDKGMEANIVWKVPFASRWQFIRELKGGVTVAGGDNTIFTQPHPYPYNPLMYCSTARITPYNADQTPDTNVGGLAVCQYAFALVTAHYITYPGGSGPNKDTQVLFNETYNPSAEFITLPAEGLYWNDANDVTPTPIAPSSAPAYLLRKSEYVYTRNKAPLVIPAIVFDYQNCVNTNAITSRTFGRTFAAETLLYEGPSLSEDRMADGTSALRVSMKFAWQSVLWNTYPRPGFKGTGEMRFETIYKGDGNAFTPYKSKALENLMMW